MNIIRQYPKILLMAASIVLSYILYRQGTFDWIEAHLDGFGYVSIVLAGMLYSFGFTTPFAVAYFIEMAPHLSPVPAALLAGLGASISDMGIFEFVSLSLHDEFLKLRATRFMQRMRALLHRETWPEKMQRAWRWTLACLVIASPLPDEIGVSLLAGLADIGHRRMALLCYGLNVAGILALLLATRAIV